MLQRATDHRMTLPDRRVLGWAEAGDPHGRPVLAFHGTPSSRLGMVALDERARAAGVRLVIPDRPGIGLSDFQPGRRLRDWPADVTSLADHLGFDRFAVLGYSGGGPYALACARFVPDRLSSIVVVSGCGPVDAPGDLLGQGFLDLLLTVGARWAPALAEAGLWVMGEVADRFPRVAIRAWAEDLTPEETALLAAAGADDPDGTMAFFRESMARGPRGVTVDYRLIGQRWGFLPEEIDAPVLLWHGDADPVVPLHDALELRARMPHAEIRIVPGAGHLLLRSRAAAILDSIG